VRTPAERVVLRRRISTEVRQVEVTVRREELQVIHLPLTGQPAGPAPQTPVPLVIVLSEEGPVVQLHTRPYEQVTVSVRTVTTEQELTGEADREQAEVTTREAGEDASAERNLSPAEMETEDVAITYGPVTDRASGWEARLPRRAPLALACPQGLADTGQSSAGPRPGGLDPRPNTGQDPADQRQHQDAEQPTTKSHGQEHDPRLPDQPPVTPHRP